MAVAAAQRSVRVLPEAPEQVTCLQQLLMDVSWNLNSRILYQPIESPEIGDRWPLVRSCADRLEMMQDFLRGRDFGRATPSYLDVACNYGWFVSKLAGLGFDAHGVEIDSAAKVIATEFLGIDRAKFVRSEVTAFLESIPARYDVVSCFSLAHHFALQGGNGMDNLLKLLDNATGSVLFFEMGDENEAWFKERLKGWNPSTIATYLQDNTTFDRVVALGTDQDRRGKFRQNYGRTLFACVRDHA
jgi:SAM-dependent methyltransferase